MNVLPSTGHERANLLLFPFKIYTALAYFAAIAGIQSLPSKSDYGEAGFIVFAGYVLSLAVFCLASMIQKTVSPRRDYLTSCGFAVADVIFLALMLPYLAHT